MRRAYRSGARAAAPPAPPSPSLGHPTEGEPSTSIPPTIPGAYWFDSITEEIVRVIEAAGLTPADTQTQLRDAIRALAAAARPPAGIIEVYAGATAPAGYLECDGSAVSRTTYAALYGAIGTTYGAGDGSTTFALPDLRRRVVMGAGGTDRYTLIGTTPGSTGGHESQVIDITAMPLHGHTMDSSGGHTHTTAIPFLRDNEASTGGNRTLAQSGATQAIVSSSAGAHVHRVHGAGGGARHPNLQPSIVLMYLISTGG